jgi:ABC-2 type transport system ATP-binding protein
MFQVQNLSFYYKEKLVFNDINFILPKGSITGLVGANGVGKTTLMRCMAGLYKPFEGNVAIENIDVHNLPHQAHQKIGYLSDSFGLYPHLSVRQSLEYTALLFNISENTLNNRIDEVLEQVQLTVQQDQQTQTLSRGQRQRLGIAQAIIHQPAFLLLDEPASGLDPQARIELSHLLKTLQKQGMTILVSSHILAELDEYCTHLMVLQNQKISEFTSLNSLNESSISTPNHHDEQGTCTTSLLHKFNVIITDIHDNTTSQFKNTLLDLQLVNEQVLDLQIDELPNTGNNDTNNCCYSFYWPQNVQARKNLLHHLIQQEFSVIEFKAVRENLQERYLKQMNR